MRYIHIAGTNGKGSVAEYLSRIITAAGEKCGCFTSPHLISPTERFRIDDDYIQEDLLNSLLREVNKEELAVNDTLFAAYTAAALIWFERNGVETAVMETGLGGRLDPTNKIDPALTVLTPIDYDHMSLLGSSLEQIAYEKCGIIKPGVPVVSTRQKKEIEKIIISRCKELNAPLYFAEQVKSISSTLNGQIFSFEKEEYSINAIGTDQPDNAALATLAAKKIGVSHEHIKTGLINTKLRCRAQYINGIPDMLLDGAHNAGAIESLILTLKKHFNDRDKVLLFACMKDKDYKTMIKILDPYFSSVILTRVDETRGVQAEKLASLFSHNCYIKEEPEQAFLLSSEKAREENALLTVTGSFYLCGDVLRQMNI